MSETPVKMTIIMEDADGLVHTIDIPKASHIKIDTRGGQQEQSIGLGYETHVKTSLDFEMSFTGILDHIKGHIFQQRMSDAKQVAVPGQVSIDIAYPKTALDAFQLMSDLLSDHYTAPDAEEELAFIDGIIKQLKEATS